MDFISLVAGKLGTESMVQVVVPSAILVAAVPAGLAISRALLFFVKKWDDKVDFGIGEPVFKVAQWRGPVNMLVPALCMSLVLPSVKLPEGVTDLLRHILSLWSICAVAFLFIRIIGVFREVILSRFETNVSDNLQARKAHTQFLVIERILVFAIMVVATATVLMTFDKVRQVGMSLLASAGVVGIVLGFAAQRSIATVVAGIQIAITQPIRLDDVVIVEGEWGWIEEITLTYVVVKIWDLRRLVLPVTYFIEKPFQNWTRACADILGTVFVHTDYTVPVEALREELRRILESTDLWDKKVCGVQVTDAKENTMEVRALMSAVNSSVAWDLRCLVREQLVEFLKKNYPDSLPRVRVDMKQDGK